MATRGIIKIEGVNFAQIYKHWDCYPEHPKYAGTKSLLDWLEAFNKEFVEERGDDPEYKFAQLLRASVRDAEEYNLDRSFDTGWGVVPYDSDYGEEYVYTLKKDGTVKCFSVYTDSEFVRFNGDK
jgi:hypothetical protein